MSTLYDQHLTCADCGHDFVWSAREQDFYREKGFQQPKRCKARARARKDKEQRGAADENRGNRK